MCNSCYVSVLVHNKSSHTLNFHCSPESGDLEWGAISAYDRGGSDNPRRIDPRKDDQGDHWINILSRNVRREEKHQFDVTGQATSGIEGRFRIIAAEGDICTGRFNIDHNTWSDSTGSFTVENNSALSAKYQVLWGGWDNKKKSPIGEMWIQILDR